MLTSRTGATASSAILLYKETCLREIAAYGYGPRGTGELLTEPLPQPDEAMSGGAQDARLVAFDGSHDHRIAGHNDITSAFTAGLLRRQMEA